MKSFREQMIKVMRARDKEVSNRDIDECTTPAAETIIKYIRQWQFGSCNIALARLLETDRWNKGGGMTVEKDFKGRDYPFEMPLAMAYENYRYGDQRRQFWPSYSFTRGIKQIPDNITPDWKAELQSMFFDMGRLNISAVKIICLGKVVKQLGVGNPHAYAQWDREVSEWKDAQKAVDDFCSTHEGWEYCTSTSIQNPQKRAELSDILEDILAKADEIVEPSYKAIKEQFRRENIRRDATLARNDIKTLGGFFTKYAEPRPNALDLLSGIINDVESKTLTPVPVKV